MFLIYEYSNDTPNPFEDKDGHKIRPYNFRPSAASPLFRVVVRLVRHQLAASAGIDMTSQPAAGDRATAGARRP